MSEPFIGEIKMVGFNFAPRGYAKCDGALIAISQNQAMFALLGNEYGGDGRVTFALPDLRGRVPMHQGRGTGLSLRKMGQHTGTESQVLQVSQLPPHNHLLQSNAEVSVTPKAHNDNATLTTPKGNLHASVTDSRGASYNAYAPKSDNTVDMAPITGTAALKGATQYTGANDRISNLQPAQVVNFIIALQGVFPTRS